MSETNAPQRSAAWFAQRRDKVTASNFGALLGCCPYTSQCEAVERARGTSAFAGNEATEWGVQQEPVAIAEYARRTGLVVTATGAHTHPDHPWLMGSPDGLVGASGIIEVKCPYYFRGAGGKRRRVHADIPQTYLLQCLVLLEVLGRAWCDFVSWAPEGTAIYRVRAQPELMKRLLPVAKDMHRVITGESEKLVVPEPAVMQLLRDVEADQEYWAYKLIDLQEPPPPPSPSLF